jgi:hypothetical protein
MVCLGFLSSKCTKQSSEVNFPTHIYLQKSSPDQKTTAVIYSWNKNDKWNILGSNYRYMLGFTKANSKWYIDYELSEGFGTYEGGILSLEWLNADEVLIKRTISDSSKDIKYNLRLNKWILIAKK